MKKQNKLYDYLEQTGILQNGSSDDIVKAKKEYWKVVRTQWRAEQRKVSKSYTVFYKPDELKEIKTAAIVKKASITSFTKHSAILAARGNTGVNKKSLGEVRQMFFETYNSVRAKAQIEMVLTELLLLEKKVLELIH
jgi:hypothetical protein